MKNRTSIYRFMGGLLVLDIACLIVSGVLKNAKHGAGNTIGTISWVGFLALSLVLILVAASVLVRAARSRSATRLTA